ncbi:MAG: hypothetical protein DIU75_016395 [Mycolicibacterium hassiacum]
MADVGDTIRLRFRVTDADDKPVDPASVTLSVYRDYDGTTDTLGPTERVETGIYTFDYVPDVPGRHIVTWTATGPAAAFTDVHYVTPAGLGLVSLDAAKRYLGIDPGNTEYDDDLRSLIAGVTGAIEDIVGAVVRRKVTERHSGSGNQIALNKGPVIGIVSVVESGVTLGPGDYSLGQHGIVTRLAGPYCPRPWQPGVDNVEVTYEIGRAVMPAGLGEAARELVRINARPLMGGNYGPYDTDPQQEGLWRLGFFLPQGVMRLLAADARPPGLA